MASIVKYETKKGIRWMYKIYTTINPITGKRRETTRRGFLTKKEAKLASAEEEKKLADGTYLEDSEIKFRELYNEWLAMRSKMTKPSTQYCIKSKFSKYILPSFENLLIKNITRTYCQTFFDNLSTTLNTKSVSNYKMYLNQVFKFAIMREYLSKNPLLHVSIQADKSKFLFEEDASQRQNFGDKLVVKQFLSILEENYSQKDFLLFHLLIFTGARKGEILALKWCDIDLERQTIQFNKTLFFEKNEYILQTPKSKKSRRIISIGEDTITLLSQWRSYEQTLTCIPTTDNDFIFKRIDGRPLRIASVNVLLNSIIEKYHLPHITVHGLRHTHASLLFESGATIKDVQERLGHTDVTMTMNIYTHVSKSAVESTAKRFQKFLKE